MHALVVAVSRDQRLHLLQQPLDERIVNGFVQHQATRGRAALPGGSERAPQYAFEGQVQVGVRHHDLRVLSAHFKGEAFVQPAAGRSDFRTHRIRAGKRHGVYVRMLHQRFARRGPSVHQIEYAGRHACVRKQFRKQRPAVRRLFAGLENDGVAAGQGRKYFPGGHGDREIPCGNKARHAYGPPDAHIEFIRQFAGDRAPEQPPRFRGRVIRGVDGLLHVPAGFGEGLAHFAGFLESERFLAFCQ